MKAVILAAGMSSRLRPFTDEIPKCLLSVADTPILRRALTVLETAGVREVAIVTGYRERQIRDAVHSWFPGRNISFISNAAYATTNNCVSMLLAEGFVDGSEFLLIDGDLVFERSLVDSLLRSSHGDCLALLPADDLGDEEMKVELDAGLRVRAMSKELPLARAAGESVGLFRFSNAHAIFDHLRARIVDRGLVDEWYEASFQQAIDHGFALHAVPAGASYVSEIDTPDDLLRVDRELRKRQEMNHGGVRAPALVGHMWGNDRLRMGRAPALGVGTVEADLMLCFRNGRYDGALMAHPGPDLPARTEDGHLAYSVEEARRVIARSHEIDAPRLETFLEDLERLDLHAFVESKVPGTFTRVRDVLKPHARRLTLISFDGEEIGEATAAGFRSGCLLKHRPTPRALEALRALYGFRMLLPDEWYVSEATVEAAHALGIEVGAWGADIETRAKALRAMGVDAIVARRPERLFATDGPQHEAISGSELPS